MHNFMAAYQLTVIKLINQLQCSYQYSMGEDKAEEMLCYYFSKREKKNTIWPTKFFSLSFSAGQNDSVSYGRGDLQQGSEEEFAVSCTPAVLSHNAQQLPCSRDQESHQLLSHPTLQHLPAAASGLLQQSIQAHVQLIPLEPVRSSPVPIFPALGSAVMEEIRELISSGLTPVVLSLMTPVRLLGWHMGGKYA